MLGTTLPIIALIAIAVVLKMFIAPPRKKKKRGPVFAKRPVSTNEQPMFFRLVQTFPDHVVLAQVAFSAIIDRNNKHWSERSDFNRLCADFVLCTKAFDVQAVIELDDASHRGKERIDARRDSLLREAGYKVLRYTGVPDATRLKMDIQTP